MSRCCPWCCLDLSVVAFLRQAALLTQHTTALAHQQPRCLAQQHADSLPAVSGPCRIGPAGHCAPRRRVHVLCAVAAAFEAVRGAAVGAVPLKRCEPGLHWPLCASWASVAAVGLHLLLVACTPGNGAGLGRLRAKELLEACRVLQVGAVQPAAATGHRLRRASGPDTCSVTLQVPAAHVTVVEDSQLQVCCWDVPARSQLCNACEAGLSSAACADMQDGMAIAWPANAVAAHVQRHLQQHPCDTVSTSSSCAVPATCCQPACGCRPQGTPCSHAFACVVVRAGADI